MCTVVVLRRPGHAWPVLIAANRDEMTSRPWLAPARHWPDRPGTVAGLDREAGGTWLGANDRGVVAGVLNRAGSLGPAAGMATRGDLPLLALDNGTAAEAAEAVAGLDARPYRAFNAVVADAADALWLRWTGDETDGRPAVHRVPEGLHMLTALDLDDAASPRVRLHLPGFRAARTPDPDSGDWSDWIERLGDRTRDSAGPEAGAMSIRGPGGFATVSSSLIALANARPRTIWMFAAGAPDKVSFRPVSVNATDCVAPADSVGSR